MYTDSKEPNNHPLCQKSIYNVGGLSILLKADLPILNKTFHPKIHLFHSAVPVDDQIHLSHIFSFSEPSGNIPGKIIYQKSPWSIKQRNQNWVYELYNHSSSPSLISQVAFFNPTYTAGTIYHHNENDFLSGNLVAVSSLINDQVFLAQILADRMGCFFHASGININGQCFLFLGHSGAGKSTIARMLFSIGNPLSLDRIIVRRNSDKWLAYGFWDSSDVSDISPDPVPIRAIFLLEQAHTNQVIPITDRKQVVRNLPFFIAKPLVTANWWEKILDLVGNISREIPVYHLMFDKSGKIIDVLHGLL